MLFAVLAILTVHTVASQSCELPQQLIGEWTSTVPNWNDLTITNTTIDTLPVDSSQVSFTCYLENGTTYIIQSPEMFLSSIRYHLYTCLDIIPIQGNNDMVYFRVRTGPNPEYNNDTVVVVLKGDNTTFENICAMASTQLPFQYDLFLRKGFENRLRNDTCPRSQQSEFQAEFTENPEMSTCPDGFIVDGCSRNHVIFNYTDCNGNRTSMGAAEYRCLYAMDVDNVVYTAIYDTNAAGGGQPNVFQAACLEQRMSEDGQQMMLTKSGRRCGDAQAVQMVLNETLSCRAPTTAAPETTPEAGTNGTTAGAGTGTGDGGQGDGGDGYTSSGTKTVLPGFMMFLASALLCVLQITFP